MRSHDRPALLGAAIALLLGACSQQPAAPTHGMASALTAALDRAFNAREWNDYRALFVSDPIRAHGPLARTQRLMIQTVGLDQTSVVERFTALGSTGVALVRTTVEAQALPEAELAPALQHTYLVFRDDGGGPRVVAHLDVGPAAVSMVTREYTGVFSCPACNFAIGSDTLEHWLVVPSPQMVSGCVETIAFYRFDSGVTLAISVTPNRQHQPAGDLVARLIADVEPDRHEDVAPWIPAAYSDALPEGMHAAQCDIVSGSTVEMLRLITRAPGEDITRPHEEIAYLISVQGSVSEIARLQDEITTLVDSFHLIDTARDPEQVGRSSACAHSGGTLDGNEYRNPRYRIACSKPAEWHARVVADRSQFGVVYECPVGGTTVRITGNPVGAGQTTDHQDRIRGQVLRRVQQKQMKLLAPLRWRNTENQRDLLATMDVIAQKKNQILPLPIRKCRVLLFGDLSVIVDGCIEEPESMARFDEIVASVRRLP